MGAVGLVSQLLLKYSSYDEDETNERSMCLYTSACEEDPELKSFGSSLDRQFSELKTSLALTGGKTENYPINAVKSVCGFLVEMNQKFKDIKLKMLKKLNAKNEEIQKYATFFDDLEKRLGNIEKEQL